MKVETRAAVAPLLTRFRTLAPAHRVSQARTFNWLAHAHTEAEATRARREGTDFDRERFYEHMQHRLSRFGCGEDKIASRGYALDDCGHTRWSEMDIYRLHEEPTGRGMYERTRRFREVARGALERMYAEREEPPGDLLHVTCTGYACPSAAQELVAAKRWGDRTRVTHVYHMGCYAAMPALRIASGFVASARGLRARGSPVTDIVHTELCSLHVNPSLHSPEQLVVQTLFADGFVVYGVCDEGSLPKGETALALLALEEEVVPDSSECMAWCCSDWGMQMTLARDVPERIEGALSHFVRRLLDKANLGREEREESVYAVHPGGPRILDRVRDALRIDEQRLHFSRKVLRERGNMSSATLPHVWSEIASSRDVPDGRAVVSLAFGPGLTVSGAVMRKVGP